MPAAPEADVRVAVVHEWLTVPGGSELVVEELLRIFPSADLFALVISPLWKQREPFAGRRLTGSPLGRIPGSVRYYKALLPLMPWAVGRYDLSGYDLIVTSHHAVAKGVRQRGNARHLCYVHSPMRYAWDQQDHYFRGRAGTIKRLAASPLLAALRRWDAATAGRPHMLLANSRFVAGRIERYWQRAAEVVHPPVATDGLEPGTKGDFFLWFGRLVPYKRPDLAVAAFSRLGFPLVVAGDGPERERLERSAPANVTFLGRVSEERRRELLASARALVFPGIEDFGMVPVEAMAAGTPVIALGRGGALETVLDGVTGVHFPEPTVAALMAAIGRFERIETSFATERLVEQAARFSPEHFRQQILAAVDRLFADMHDA